MPRDQLQGAGEALLAQGKAEKTLEMGSGGGVEGKAISSSSLTGISRLGTEPWAQKAWEHQGVPCVLRRHRNGEQILGVWSLP